MPLEHCAVFLLKRFPPMTFALWVDIFAELWNLRFADRESAISVLDDIRGGEHYWTISTQSGEYGLVGFGPSPYRGRCTTFELGKLSASLELSVYAVLV